MLLDRNIDQYSVKAAAHVGKFNVRLTDDTEKLIKTNNITIKPNSADFAHYFIFRTGAGTRNISQDALIAIETTRELAKRFDKVIRISFLQNLQFFVLFFLKNPIRQI